MIIPFFLIVLEGIAAQSNLWNDWTAKISQAFGYTAKKDESFIDVLWNQLDFGKATSSSSTSILDGWLTGIKLDDYLSGMNSKLSDLLKNAGDTSKMNTSQIVAAIRKSGFNSTTEGWAKDVNLQDVLKELHTMAADLEALSFKQGMNLKVFPSLGKLESVLKDYGYSDLYTLDDVNKFLKDKVGTEIPDSYKDYQSDLEDIEEMLTDIIARKKDAPSITDVSLKMAQLIAKLQAEVNGGSTDLKDALDDLILANKVLSIFGKSSSDNLLDLSEDLLSLFTETKFDFDGLDNKFGIDWLSSFVSAMQEIYSTDHHEYEVCPDSFIKDILKKEYSWYQYPLYCPMLMFGQTPNCRCLNNAGIYGNEDKKVVLKSMNCRFNKADKMSVEQILRKCNGEKIDVADNKSEIKDAFKTLDGLTDLLTDTNYGKNLILDRNITVLSNEFKKIIGAMEVLSGTKIVSDGSNKDYMDSVSDYLDKFKTLVSDLNLDGTYSEQSKAISDLVSSAFNSFKENDSAEQKPNEPQEPTKGGRAIAKWVWVVVALGILGFLLGVYCCYVKRKNNKLDRITVETEIEGFGAQYREPVRTSVTLGEGEI